MTRALVLGADGMLGHMLVRVLAPSMEVVGAIRRSWSNSHPLARFLAVDRCIDRLDVLDADRLREAVTRIEPDFILNAVGIVKQSPLAQEPLAAIDVNSRFPHQLAAIAASKGSLVIHFSTDCVFSGNQGAYTEDDAPDPVDLYGRSKLLGELEPREGLTIRTSIVGRELVGAAGLFEWAISMRNRAIKGFTHARFSGLTTLALSKLIAELLSTRPDLRGVWHVASDPISKFDLLVTLDNHLGLNLQIEPDPSPVCDRSLDGQAFVNETGLVSPSWPEMLDAVRNDDHNYDFRLRAER